MLGYMRFIHIVLYIIAVLDFYNNILVSSWILTYYASEAITFFVAP